MSILAHEGQKILVTEGGKPWVLLVPPAVPNQIAPSANKLNWPNFVQRLAKHYQVSSNGPTATELLAQDKEDRF
jgi:hypothetical protein